MAKVSKQNSKYNEEVLESLFYYKIWKKRLEWTGHFIPVRVFDQERGFFVEGYLDIVPQVTSMNQKVEVKLAFLPISVPDTIFVKITDFYPSSRNLTIIKDGSIIPVSKNEEHAPTKKIPKSNLEKLFKAYKGCEFSHKELESMLNNDLTLDGLVESSMGRCLITNTIVQKYNNFCLDVITISSDDNMIQDSFHKLYNTYKNCTGCDLGKKRINRLPDSEVVTGRLALNTWNNIEGDTSKTIMFIGEAPGMQEEATGVCFNQEAPAGGVLFKVIQSSGLDYNRCYFTNAVLCRPESNSSKVQNEKPNVAQIDSCNLRLKNELSILKPIIVVLLGKVAYRSFYGKEPINVLSSSGWQNKQKTVYFMPHPSFVVRELSFAESDKTASIKSKYLQHFLNIKEKYLELTVE